MEKTKKEQLKKAISEYLLGVEDMDVKMVKNIDTIRVDDEDGIVSGYFEYKDSFDVEHTTNYRFSIDHLKVINRNLFIEGLLVESDPVEDMIYTDSQKEKLDRLRSEREYEKGLTTEEQNRLDRDNSFKLGDSITFDGNPGIITFVGGINRNGMRKYTVKLQDDREHRFVLGRKLKVRKVRERIKREDIPTKDLKEFDRFVDKFDKMTTARIIKWKNAKNWDYINRYSDMSIEKRAMLYVLQDREHHTRKNKIVVRYDKSE